MDYEQIIADIKKFLDDYECHAGSHGEYCFHNDVHTADVVEAAKEMAGYYNLTDEQKFILVSAGYFHDIGYLNGGAANHELRSADMALEFLKKYNVSEDILQQIKGCILATKMPQQPKNLLEQIMCDADLFHLGGDNFQERNKLMRKEAECMKGIEIDKDRWRNNTIKLMETHQYHTDYAKAKRGAKKEENLQLLLEKNKKNGVKDKPEAVAGKGSVKGTRPERGIETMFRISSSNNQRLSDMADNKANILLTVNSIILSIVVAGLFRKLDSNEHLIIPTFILVLAVVLTMVLAILSTIPKIPSGVFKQEDVNNKTVNLLFFGNFYKMPFQNYQEGMNKVMQDSEFLYSMMTKDVYSQGIVLGRKYRLLRYAYGVFMFGLILSVVAFFISIITY